ncbi:expressed unknown protein [Seminavis robusta]|uniref:Uncharacterized protein n=1 Tax=Seminavis robusta TaxID=568900 RepID=A0A9N8D952_9STRA|nr:expressed unknown protein [Seminavis robusta]|eukprot:Sro2_g001810.1 n/a (185) ;mRNA; r:251339-251893
MSIHFTSDEAFPSSADYNLWISNAADVVMQDEELSASSYEEATKVLEQWQTEDEEMRIMELDMELGSNLLEGFALFDSNGTSNEEAPMEELLFQEEIVLPTEESMSSSSSSSSTSSSSIESSKDFKMSLRKLSESMKRSHETRKSLVMTSPKTERYARSNSVTGVISSIEKSSEQIQAYLMCLQ